MTTLNAKPINSVVAFTTRPGDHFLVTMPHYWGRDPVLSGAIQKMRDAGGRPGKYWRIHSVHPGTSVNALGQIDYPTDHPPVMLAESNPS